MFKFTGFTSKANDAVNIAIAKAETFGHTYIGSEHLLLGLLEEKSGVAYTALLYKNVSAEALTNVLLKTVGKGQPSRLAPTDITPRCRLILENAVLEAKKCYCPLVGTEHILLSILREKDSYAVKFLKSLNVDIDSVETLLSVAIGESVNQNYLTEAEKQKMYKKNKEKPKLPTLERFGKDLTQKAEEKQLDPVFLRDKEVLRVMQILARRTKNNPCLIGAAGVGKTAVVEALAQKIASGCVCDDLKDKRIITLDIVSMIAGTKYRGEFEERVKDALEEAAKNKNVILFIDEIHTIVGAGGAEGAIDASNILKPQLARGEIQIIGATTTEEYRRYIEKDSALARRFQTVYVSEPSKEQTVMILKGLRPRYEQHHKIVITDKAIEAAAELGARYINDRFLPDKAIDLIDEAASKVKLSKVFETSHQENLREGLLKLKEQKENAILSQNFQKAANFYHKEIELEEKMQLKMVKNQLRQYKTCPKVTEESIAQVIESITGIDAKSLTQEKKEKLLLMEEEISKRVIGQDIAVKAITKAIIRGKTGISDPNRPVGSFLFLGPTGVGKTELSKALSKELFGKEDYLVTFDMSEYMEKSSVAKLIGSPPGYVGYEDAPALTEKIKRRPYCVLLFDEIEKAHPDVHNLLLQVLEEGVLTDSRGTKVSFKETVIIMTSNVGARFITENAVVGFNTGTGTKDKIIKENVLTELKRSFSPEFLNRIDDVIVFNKLKNQDINKITEKLMKSLEERLETMKINLTVSDSAIETISIKGYDERYGARPLRRYIQNNIEDTLAEMIVKGDIAQNQTVILDTKDEEFSFTVK